MSEKITRLPGMWRRRRQVDLRRGIVHCQVSGRRLQFPKYGSKLDEGTFLIIDVLSTNENGKTRKLCEVVLTKEDLLAVINQLPEK
jgi:hypothetical protein